MLTNKIYDVLKYISTILIPALVVLIASISAAVGFDASVICAIIGAIGVFVGSLIGVSTSQYNKRKGENGDGSIK